MFVERMPMSIHPMIAPLFCQLLNVAGTGIEEADFVASLPKSIEFLVLGRLAPTAVDEWMIAFGIPPPFCFSLSWTLSRHF